MGLGAYPEPGGMVQGGFSIPLVTVRGATAMTAIG